MAEKILRIISMDGGNGLFTAMLLKELSQKVREKLGDRLPAEQSPPIIGNANLLTGASAGGINSLLLASQTDPDNYVLGDLIQDWEEIMLGLVPLPTLESLIPKPHENPFIWWASLYANLFQTGAQVASGLSGLTSIFNNDQLRNTLTQHFAQKTLGDLRKNVIVVSFQLDNEAEAPEIRQWQPKTFNNFSPNGRRESCLDVGMRTCAQPVLMPVFQSTEGVGSGYVDGAYVANNPGMVALSAMLDHIRKRVAGGGSVAVPQDRKKIDENSGLTKVKVQMLSLGAGVRQMFPMSANHLSPPKIQYQDGSAHWGYSRWLLNPAEPLTMVNMFLQSNSQEVDFQVRSLLGDENFCRLAPKSVMENQSETELKAILCETPLQEDLDRTAEWLIHSGWLEAEEAPKEEA